MKVKHQWQSTGYGCGAAAVAMILGIPEKDAYKLAGTERSGTSIRGAAEALRSSGHPVHIVNCGRTLTEYGWQLEEQSNRWPLWVHLSFPTRYRRKDKRTFLKNREHAVVLYQGKLYDPGERETLEVGTLGHLSDGEIVIQAYCLVEMA